MTLLTPWNLMHRIYNKAQDNCGKVKEGSIEEVVEEDATTVASSLQDGVIATAQQQATCIRGNSNKKCLLHLECTDQWMMEDERRTFRRDSVTRSRASKVITEHEATTVQQQQLSIKDQCQQTSFPSSSSFPLHHSTSQPSSGALYGREMERKSLIDVYNRKSSSSLEVVFICGPSGTGKTSLAFTLRDRVQSDNGFFVAGKCELLPNQDMLEQNTRTELMEPYGPLIEALSDFFEQVVMQQQEEIEHIHRRISDALSEYEIHVLESIIPHMSIVTAKCHSITVEKTSEGEVTIVAEPEDTSLVLVAAPAQKNPKIVKLAFQRLLRSLGRLEFPLVLCLDDLQWADNASTELLDDIVVQIKSDGQEEGTTTSKEGGGGLLILACFREDEQSESRFHFDTVHGMEKIAMSIKARDEDGIERDASTRATTRMTRISIGALTFDSVADMTSNQLGLTRENSAPLTKLIYHQSKGNAFIIHHILRALNDKKSSCLEDATFGRNNRSTSTISCINDNGNFIINMMVRTLQNLPVTASYLLTVASCLHTEFSAKLLHQASYDPSTSDGEGDVSNVYYIESALLPAIEKGLVILVQRGIYSFCHDKVQEAAYSLIRQQGDEKKFLLEVGRRLQSNFTDHEMVKNVFLLTRLLSPGVDLMDAEGERENLVVLCLAAGRRATRSSSFATALEYIEFGISLLSRRNWRDQYELSLELYNAASELSHCTGDHDRVDELVDSVLCNAKSFEHEMQAHRSKILSLGARGKRRIACELGFALLRRLGHPLPMHPGSMRIKLELWRTQRRCASMESSDFMSLPIMSNTRAMSCMSILHLLHPIMAASLPGMTTMLGILMVRLTLEYGLCSISSVGFAFYGVALARHGYADEGYKYGIIAFQLLDKLNARELAGKTRLSMACGAQSMKEPIRKAANSMLFAHEIGMKTGDIETSIRSLNVHAVLRLYIGDSLPAVATTFYRVEELCSEYGQRDTSATRSWNDAHRALLGKISHLSAKQELQVYLDDGSPQPGLYMLCGWYYLAVFVDDIDFSNCLILASQKLNYNLFSAAPFVRLFQTFYEAIVETDVILRSSKSYLFNQRTKRICKRLKELRTAAHHCPRNVWNKVYLVEANLEVINENYGNALVLYEKSIQLAKDEGYLSEEALAFEKIGRMEIMRKRESESMRYLSASLKLYEQWGAKVKVEQISQVLGNLRSHGMKAGERSHQLILPHQDCSE